MDAVEALRTARGEVPDPPPCDASRVRALVDELADAGDVAAMLERGLVEPDLAWQLYEAIVPGLPRFPAINAPTFRTRMEAAFGPEPRA
jgi:hypothetical protein